MKLNLYGNFDGNLGYNVHTRGFFDGLKAAGADIKAVPYDVSFRSKDITKNLIDSIKRDFHYDAPSVCISYGNDMEKFTGSKRIGYTVWETSKLPRSWPKSMNRLDEVWTVSKHSKTAMENSGVEKDIKIVPEGVDTTMFSPFVDKHKKDDNFLFMSIMKWEARKNPALMLEAYSEEFKPEEKVLMVVQMHNPFIRGFDTHQAMFNLNLGKHAPIRVMPFIEERSELARMYATADCFVFPTSGESWGLPPIESLACGTPVITTNWGGCLEYMNNDYGWLIDVEGMEEPNDGVFFKKDQFPEGNEWAIPSKKHLRELMRYAFEHPEECKKKGGSNSYEYVDKNFTWELAGKKALDLLKV